MIRVPLTCKPAGVAEAELGPGEGRRRSRGGRAVGVDPPWTTWCSRIRFRASRFSGSSRLSTVPSGNWAKAASVGANTVSAASPVSASTRPAALAAATRVLKVLASTATVARSRSSGRMTRSTTWMTPFSQRSSAVATVASPTRSAPRIARDPQALTGECRQLRSAQERGQAHVALDHVVQEHRAQGVPVLGLEQVLDGARRAAWRTPRRSARRRSAGPPPRAHRPGPRPSRRRAGS